MDIDPSQAPGVAYLVLFSLAAILHIGLGFRYKYWIVFVTLIPGGLRECRSSLRGRLEWSMLTMET